MTENLFYPLALCVAWLLLALSSGRPGGACWRCSRRSESRLRPAPRRSRSCPRSPRRRWCWRSSRAGGRELSPFVALYAVFGGAAVLVVARAGSSRPVAERPSRRLQRRRRRRLRRGHGPALLALARRGADLYLGVVPVAATSSCSALGRRLPPRLQEHLAVTVALVWTTLVVATFASGFAWPDPGAVRFVIAPLFLIALLAWVALGAPRPAWRRGRGAASRSALSLALPVHALHRRAGEVGHARAPPDVVGPRAPRHSARSGSPSRSWAPARRRCSCSSRRGGPSRCRCVVLAASCVVFGARLVGPARLCPGGRRRALPGHPRRRRATGSTHALPTGQEVVVLWTGRADRFTVNQNEFFNRRVGASTTPTPDARGIARRRSRRPGGGILVRRRLACHRCSSSLRAPRRLITPDGVIVARETSSARRSGRWPGSSCRRRR